MPISAAARGSRKPAPCSRERRNPRSTAQNEWPYQAGQRRQPCLQDKGTPQKSRKPREEAGWGQRWRTRQVGDGYGLWPPSPSNAPSPSPKRTNTPQLIPGIVPGPLASLTGPAQPFRVPSKSSSGQPNQHSWLSFSPAKSQWGPKATPGNLTEIYGDRNCSLESVQRNS